MWIWTRLGHIDRIIIKLAGDKDLEINLLV